MRNNHLKPVYRLQHSFLDSVIKEGLIITSNEQSGKFKFLVPPVLKRAKAGGHGSVQTLTQQNLIVNLLIDTSTLSAEQTNQGMNRE
ncbi:hypothetical protein [Domibacillus indicus]|uniref:hypothetical protein n=1 Tax=Domibacillus indicus TaxID=1437523 RepID=UPI000617F2E2|nr:hypothetical protein [Domibacillus indicus]